MRRIGAAWLAALSAAVVGLVAPGFSRAEIVLSIPSDTVTVGEVFTLPVSVSGTAGLTSFQFDLGFNPAILQVLSFDDSTTDFAAEASAEGGSLTGITGFVDNTAGLLSGIADSMSGNSGAGLTPSGTIADITFEAIHSGFSPLTCSNAFLTDNNNFLSSANEDFSLQCGDVTVPEPPAWSILGVTLFVLAAAQWLPRARRKSN